MTDMAVSAEALVEGPSSELSADVLDDQQLGRGRARDAAGL